MEEKQSMFNKMGREIAVYSLFNKKVIYFRLMPRQPCSNDRGFKCTNLTGEVFKKSPFFCELPQFVQCLCNFGGYWHCHIFNTTIAVAVVVVAYSG